MDNWHDLERSEAIFSTEISVFVFKFGSNRGLQSLLDTARTRRVCGADLGAGRGSDSAP